MAEDLSGNLTCWSICHKKTNLDKLKGNILLQSEILDLKTVTDNATGVVIGQRLIKKGPVSTV